MLFSTKAHYSQYLQYFPRKYTPFMVDSPLLGASAQFLYRRHRPSAAGCRSPSQSNACSCVFELLARRFSAYGRASRSRVGGYSFPAVYGQTNKQRPLHRCGVGEWSMEQMRPWWLTNLLEKMVDNVRYDYRIVIR